jgi:MFS family permease
MTSSGDRDPKPEPSDADPDARANFALLALHQIVIRIGWIFKTESVIIPAFLDSLSGAGWVRGILPVSSRIGQSVPAFLLSAPLQRMPRKKLALAASTAAMGVPFLLLAVWTALSERSGAAAAATFLVVYVVFFGFSGINQVVTGTLQGKLVRANRRGALISASVFGSMVPAVGLVWLLLPGWLEGTSPAWPRIFGITVAAFFLAAAVALMLRERPDARRSKGAGFRDELRGAARILRDDRDYRRAVIVAALFNSAVMLFPHYQALGRERLALGGAQLMVWVVSQNVAMGFASLLVGRVADRFGNRLALRGLVFAAGAIPLLAIALTYLEPETGRRLYPAVFVSIALVPIGFRVITNYLLEISPPESHAQYLSLSQLFTGAIFLAAPLFGLLIDLASFELAFGLQAGLMGLGGILTFGLAEPRHLGR